MTETVTGAPAEHFADLQKYRVHYWEADSGHPVIVLHGGSPGATGMTNYSQNIGPLARHFRVFAIDIPGWGTARWESCWRTVPVAGRSLVAGGDRWRIREDGRPNFVVN